MPATSVLHLPASPRGSTRPFARATLGRRRLGWRLALGLTPAQAARAEGMPEAEVLALLAEPGFAGLVAEYEALADQPEDQARKVLTRIARIILEEAVCLGDVRVAFFVLREEGRGRDPARTLADGVVAARRRATAVPTSRPADSPTAPSLSPAAPRAPDDPADIAAWHVAARLRDALVTEHAVVHQAAGGRPVSSEPAASSSDASGTPAPTAAQPSTRPAKPSRSPNRRERRRLAALVRRQSRPDGPPPPPPRDRRPPPRSRGP